MLKQDKEFAALLCEKDPEARRSFQEIYTDELYFVASKFANIGFSEDAWDYRTKKGYNIQVNDDVADTYVWLIHQVQIKSCLYKGLAEFKNYILSVLNSSFMKKDWLKWKTGVTGYIPKHIKLMGNQYADIYKLMRQKKDDETIAESLNIDHADLIGLKHDIHRSLVKHGQLDLVENYKISSLSLTNDEGNVIYDPEDTGLSVADNHTLSLSVEKIEDIILKFNKAEQFIATAFWGKSLSAEDVFYYLKEGAPKLLLQAKIESVNDVYKFKNKFINKFCDEISSDANPITVKGAKTIIENYYVILRNKTVF
ncbi:hypothetical protein OAQ02_04015 [Candidatus Marinimicrobia bacterium]|nr:hypothetical protein [Candidatus Neomarinimicrobiota bacterium]